MSFTSRSLQLGFASALLLGSASMASAQYGQPQGYPPPAAPQAYQPPPAAPPPVAAPMAPAMMPPAAPAPERVVLVNDATEGDSDHALVVGKKGVEAINIPFGTPGATVPALGPVPNITAAGVRMWMTNTFAWNVDLAFALAGGSVTTAGSSKSLDTAFGFGPNGGVSMMLGNWKHMSISFAPQATILYFTPGSKGGKSTFLVSLRPVMEAEVHFGFMKLPGLSVGLNAGPALNYVSTSDTSSAWTFSMIGANSFAQLLGGFLRFYF